MIEGLKPYAEYKESGSQWIGSVPSNWTVRNMRTLISSRSERNRSDLPLLSVAREKGVFVRSLTDANENHNFIPDDLTNYKVAHAGDLVVNKMKAWQGSMGIAPCDGIVSPAYFVFEFRIANRAFGQALLRSKPYVAHFGQASDGVRIGQWDLSIPGMRQIPILMPNEDEQSAIVRFIDHANRKINRFILDKRKLIELLNEQKQIIIHRAVTCGLDPKVSLKPSGIEGIEKIPVGWDCYVLKRAFDVKLGKMLQSAPASSEDTLEPYLRAANIFWSGVNLSDVNHMWFSPNDKNQLKLEVDDLLVTEGGDVGRTAIWKGEMEICYIQNAINRVRSKGIHSTHFLYYWLYMLKNIGYIDMLCNKATIAHFTEEKVGVVPIVAPLLHEQRAIASFLDREVARIDSLISPIKDAIALVREYRTRLISDAVTGKLDVRGVEVPSMDEAEVLEDIDTGEDTETESEELIETEEATDADN